MKSEIQKEADKKFKEFWNYLTVVLKHKMKIEQADKAISLLYGAVLKINMNIKEKKIKTLIDPIVLLDIHADCVEDVWGLIDPEDEVPNYIG